MPGSSTTENAVEIVPKNFTTTHSDTVSRPVLAPRVDAWRHLLSATHARLLVLVLLGGVSLGFRSFHLGAYGYSEDETNKLRAIEAYRHFDFSANAEHPMIMKVAMLASVEAVDVWNAVAPRLHAPTIAPEAALRFPNALAGSLITVLIFLFCELLFGTSTAFWASLFWTLDVNAAAINRIGKEDTLLLFFLFLAAWLHERGKRQSLVDPVGAQRWFARSGGAFGLMMATKYMPHYFGLHGLFLAAADQEARKAKRNEGDGPRPWRYYRTMAIAFAIANCTLLLPQTWQYLRAYVQGDMQEHTGYSFAHHIFINNFSATPFGTPPWFYATALGAKIPLFMLVLIALGLVQLWVRRSERGFVFLRVFVLFALVPYSLVASKFLRYMLPIFAILDIVAAVGVVWLLKFLQQLLDQRGSSSSSTNRSAWGLWRPRIAMAGIVIASILDPLSALVSSAPFYSLHQNGLASSFAPPGWLFPDDEFYDAGVREAVADIAAVAKPGAIIASDAKKVVQVYLERAGRTDIEARSLSSKGLPMHAAETWVVVQDAHIYFENRGMIEQLRARGAPVREYRVGGGVAVQVFRFPH
jgi:hypothetical protein